MNDSGDTSQSNKMWLSKVKDSLNSHSKLIHLDGLTDGHHSGLPWTNFEVPYFKHMTIFKATPQNVYAIAAFQFSLEGILLVKYRLDDPNPNNEETSIEVLAWSCPSAHPDPLLSTPPKSPLLDFISLDQKNRITSLSFSPLTPKQQDLPTDHPNFDSPQFIFTGDLNGIIKKWDFNQKWDSDNKEFRLVLMQTYSHYEGIAIFDMEVLPSMPDMGEYREGGEGEGQGQGQGHGGMDRGWEGYYDEDDVWLVSCHWDGTVRKFCTADVGGLGVGSVEVFGISLDHAITSMAVGRMEDRTSLVGGGVDDKWHVLVGNAHGILRRLDFTDWRIDFEYDKVGSKNKEISKIIWLKDDIWVFDGSGSIKKFQASQDHVRPVKLNEMIDGPIRHAIISPDELSLVIATKRELKRIGTKANSCFGGWTTDDPSTEVKGLLYTSRSIVQIDTRGIKIRYDTHFAVENEIIFKAITIYAASFDKSERHLWVLGNFGDLSAPKVEEEGMTSSNVDNLLGYELRIKKYDFETKTFENFEFNHQIYPLAGKSFCMRLSTDNKRLVATSFTPRRREIDHVQMNIFDAASGAVIWRLEEEASRIVDVQFSDCLDYLFVAFFQDSCKRFHIKWEGPRQMQYDLLGVTKFCSYNPPVGWLGYYHENNLDYIQAKTGDHPHRINSIN